MSPRHQVAKRIGAIRAQLGFAHRKMHRSGFTLLELMVALAILAIALSAVMRAVGAATNNVDELRARTLAGWVADNRLAEHRARRDWLPVGRFEGQVEQGGVTFRWAEEIQATPNASFRRIEVSVWSVPAAGSSSPSRVLSTLNGFLTASGATP